MSVTKYYYSDNAIFPKGPNRPFFGAKLIRNTMADRLSNVPSPSQHELQPVSCKDLELARRAAAGR
eukprot:3987751-Pleurochrysis_carterae.AAC.4